MTLAVAVRSPRVLSSVPAPGLSLATATEKRAVHVRTAVETVREKLGDGEHAAEAWRAVLASRWRQEVSALPGGHELQAAWALTSIRVVGRSLGALQENASLRDAEAWFLGSIRPPTMLSEFLDPRADRDAVNALESIEYDDDVRDLLPYVLDAYGPGSRASVIKDPRTTVSRRAKREAGAFQTPSDVADYITREVCRRLEPLTGQPHILDPACGSGVFLKAALRFAIAEKPNLEPLAFVENSLYGIDVNPLAIDAACFVLLHECLASHAPASSLSPWSQWHRIRCNLSIADALAFQLVPPPKEAAPSELAALRTQLLDSYVPAATEPLDPNAGDRPFGHATPLGSAFPALALGANAIIGNPPYATLGSRKDLPNLMLRFASCRANRVAKLDHFPLFIEMMWQLVTPTLSSSGMVVPLAVAYSTRGQMLATRHAMRHHGGRWRFAFFDREPHALFGEEIKTRNAIVFRDHSSTQGKDKGAAFATGPLRKWTSRQRAHLFDSIRFTPLEGVSIAAGIPKLEGEQAARVFAALSRLPWRMQAMCASASTVLPQDSATTCPDARVFVAGTAYNFLNVFLRHQTLPPQRAPWSASKLLALDFQTADQALRAYALLSSRLTYWLWHVTGDGFHVTRRFVLQLPFEDAVLNARAKRRLTSLGIELWETVQSDQIVSVNGGRQSVAYRPHGCEGLRDSVDSILLDAFGIDATFGAYLQQFVRQVIAVDEHDPTRRHLVVRGPA